MNGQPDELLDLLAPDLAQLLVDEDRDAFVCSALARFPNDDPGMIRSLAGALYRAMPLPGRGFTQESKVKIGRNDACPCGSGRKYKQCCGTNPEPPLPPAEGLLHLVLPHMSNDQWRYFSQHPDMPADYCADLAWHCMYSDKPQKAWEVIKPLADRLDTLGDQHQHALAYGLDALHSLGYDRKRVQLMEALSNHPHSRSLRSVGHQRLAMVKMERNEVAAAEHHLEEARRNDPDQLELHVAELSVLPYLVSDAELRQRAQFWQKRLQKRYGPDYPFQEMVDDIAARGRLAVEALTGHPVRNVKEAAEVEVSSDETERLSASLDDLGIPTEVLLAQQLADALHQVLGQSRMTLIPDDRIKDRSTLAGDRDFVRLEHEWLEAWVGGAVPVGDAPDITAEHYPAQWENPMPAWMTLLQIDPTLLGSFLVLSELQKFLASVPTSIYQNEDFNIDTRLLMPFAMHRLSCLYHLLRQWDGEKPMVDDAQRNHALLSCIDETVSDLWDQDFRHAAPMLSEQLLALLPEDPVGLRFELAAHYALLNEHEAIEWLYQRYRQDTRFPDVSFARLIQLWQQGDSKALKQHIKVLGQHFPEDLEALRRGDFEALPLGETVWEFNSEIRESLK